MQRHGRLCEMRFYAATRNRFTGTELDFVVVQQRVWLWILEIWDGWLGVLRALMVVCLELLVVVLSCGCSLWPFVGWFQFFLGQWLCFSRIEWQVWYTSTSVCSCNRRKDAASLQRLSVTSLYEWIGSQRRWDVIVCWTKISLMVSPHLPRARSFSLPEILQYHTYLVNAVQLVTYLIHKRRSSHTYLPEYWAKTANVPQLLSWLKVHVPQPHGNICQVRPVDRSWKA